MSENTDLIKLYSGQILALAAEIPHTDRLDSPQATVKRRSPLCGSTVTVDITMNGDRVSEFGQDVKACALGQAAASVVGGAIIGRTEDEIRTAQSQLKAMLKSGGPAPDTPFDGLKVLLPAKEFRNRHASIMLALNASVEAIEQIRKANCA
ncbi:NifU homolog involved in Fe-S cluster formation [Litoreibacter ascidiaceicola]|uniref:NifU homolog involved in Fe-S cluster formation n=1 Tax=Litoreibacter ascidiaceicola TaxID=1486859 RepID=A0A1M4VU56_9RHOB|nr:iron-sulfur cluster assembly scaffold protein [Litoreibacter ascidiaceicola]SHE72373.1 NifU homolog involved in Fe-S cluster formation [Litoreibacter ascidiaceicola]